MKTTRTRTLAALYALVAAAFLFTAGCKSTSSKPSAAAPAGAAGAQARATIEPRSGSNVSGWATFTERSRGGVRIEVHIENATPGTHGIHLHEKGDCSAPDASSAGGHFNPGGMQHAGPMDAMRHAGDFGNITIEANGTGHLDLVSDVLTVRPGPNSVVGKAIVFHEKVDDPRRQRGDDSIAA